MKRVFLAVTLAAATILSACGDQTQNVTRGQTLPLGFGNIAPDHSGGTSTRTSLDLLSLG